MSNFLEFPDSSASTEDWRAWMDELKDMRQTADVKSAIRRAEQVLNTRRSSEKRAVRATRERFEMADVY